MWIYAVILDESRGAEPQGLKPKILVKGKRHS